MPEEYLEWAFHRARPGLSHEQYLDEPGWVVDAMTALDNEARIMDAKGNTNG